MATQIFVPVAKIENIRPHPNADKLELCDILGWQMVVPKGRHQNGEVVVYVPADSLIPDMWAQRWNVKAYLKGPDNDRVGKIKLRGEPSFGLAVPVPEGQEWAIGDNVADFFGITKYEPPIRTNCGDAGAENSLIQRYTDIDNLRNYPNAFIDGEEVIATEKIHGCNVKLGLVEGEEVAASMSFPRKRPTKEVDGEMVPCSFDDAMIKQNHFWFPWTIKQNRDLIYALSEETKARQILLYGEVYGPIQKGYNYGTPEKLAFVAFDILLDGKYLDYDKFRSYCDKYGVETAPLLYRGPYSIAKIKEVSGGKSVIDGKTVREGVVVQPPVERTERRIGRLKMKYISDDYLLGSKDENDSKDV